MHALAHDFVFEGRYALRLGMMRAAHESARHAFPSAVACASTRRTQGARRSPAVPLPRKSRSGPSVR